MKLFTTVLASLVLFVVATTAISKPAPPTLLMIYTTDGKIGVKLDDGPTVTTHNFLHYAKEGFYNETLFHRVIDGFMIQGGGFLAGMKEKNPIAAPIKNEGRKCGKNKRGTLSMARTSDPDSATGQFFINVADNSFLDFTEESIAGWGYCAFGHVVEGMEVVDKIKSELTTTRGSFQDVPVQDVLIKRVEIINS